MKTLAFVRHMDPNTNFFLSLIRALSHGLKLWNYLYRRPSPDDRERILEGLKKIETFTGLEEEQRHNLKEKVIEIESAISRWYRNTSSRLRDQREDIIFQQIRVVLVDLKEVLNSETIWETKKKQIETLLHCCRFLEEHSGSIYHGSAEELNSIRSDQAPDNAHKLRTRKPPIYNYLVIAWPLFLYCLYLFYPFFQNFQVRIAFNSLYPKKDPDPFAKKDNLCPQSTTQNQYADSLHKRLIGHMDDDGFNPFREMIKDILAKSSDEKTYVLPGTAAELITAINVYQRDNPPRKESYKLDRVKPLLHILRNNEEIDKLNKEQSKWTYLIAVSVPFGPSQSDGPLPLGLGVLRGVDMAQKKLIRDKNSKVLLKVVIVNDFFSGSGINSSGIPQQLSHYLANEGYRGSKFVGLLGHQQTDISNLTDDCYEEYKLPVLLSNIQNRKSNYYVQSLLPTSKELAIKIRQSMERYWLGVHQNLIIFYDSSDTSSMELSEELCVVIRKSPYFTGCDKRDINTTAYLGELIKDQTIFNQQWFFAFNPFAGFDKTRDNSEKPFGISPLNMGKATAIINQYKKNFKNINQGVIYVGPDFVDQKLKNDMNMIVNQSDVRIWRFSPWDWRVEENNQRFLDYHKNYGTQYTKCLNWYTINSFNSLLLYHQLIDNLVNYPGFDPDIQTTKHLREHLAIKLAQSGKPYRLEASMPRQLLISTRNNSLLVDQDQIYRVPLTALTPGEMLSQPARDQSNCE